MQWPGSATAGHRVSWRGVCDRCRHTAAVQPAVRFGGGSLYRIATMPQSAAATRHRPHTCSGDCRAWTLQCALPAVWAALCEKNGCISRLNTARLQLLTSVTWHHQFSYTTMLPVLVHHTIPFISTHPHVDRPARERRPRHILRYFRCNQLAPDCSWSIGLGL